MGGLGKNSIIVCFSAINCYHLTIKKTILMIKAFIWNKKADIIKEISGGVYLAIVSLANNCI